MATGLKFRNITTATTTVVSSGPCRFVALVVGKFTASSVITIYDNTAASGTLIATITSPATLLSSYGEFYFDVDCATGLTIVTSQADNLTALYSND